MILFAAKKSAELPFPWYITMPLLLFSLIGGCIVMNLVYGTTKRGKWRRK